MPTSTSTLGHATAHATPQPQPTPSVAVTATRATGFFTRLHGLLDGTAVTRRAGDAAAIPADLGVDAGSDAAVRMLHDAQLRGAKVLTLGNGGSSVIAEHISVDLSNRAAVRARTLGSAPQLSALANDNQFEDAYAIWLCSEADPGDVVVLVSSSGASPNITNAAAAARQRGCGVITVSGFRHDNPLRRLGDLNFHVDSSHYGEVEIAHEALSHYVTDRCVALALTPAHADLPAAAPAAPAAAQPSLRIVTRAAESSSNSSSSSSSSSAAAAAQAHG